MILVRGVIAMNKEMFISEISKPLKILGYKKHRNYWHIDYKHSGNHKFPHMHEWDWSKTPPRSGPLSMP